MATSSDTSERGDTGVHKEFQSRIPEEQTFLSKAREGQLEKEDLRSSIGKIVRKDCEATDDTMTLDFKHTEKYPHHV